MDEQNDIVPDTVLSYIYPRIRIRGTAVIKIFVQYFLYRKMIKAVKP